MRRGFLRAAALVALLTITGCVGAHGRAVERGNLAASAGDWDAAAAAYGEAARLDPDDPETRAALAHARAQRLARRAAAIDALAVAGRTVAALRAAAALVALEPSHPEATRRFDGLAASALDEADAARSAERLESAIELADAVLGAGAVRAVDGPRARAIGDAARAALTERVVVEAESAIQAERHGHAVLLLAALGPWGVVDARATALATAARSAVREATTWRVGVRPTAVDVEHFGLGGEVDAAHLQASLDPSFAIRLVQLDGGGQVDDRTSTRAADLDAVLALAVQGMAPHRTSGRTEGQCAWVCGTTTAPNPRVASLRASIEASRDGLRRAERRVDDRGGERRMAEREQETSRQAEEAAKDDVDTARRDLSTCRTASSTAPPGGPQPCAAEEQARSRADLALERATRAHRSAADALARARAEEEMASRARESERASLQLATGALASTPATIEIERTCHERYDVEQGAVVAVASVRVSFEEGGRRTEETLGARHEVRDQGHGARPGTCRELAAVDPLELPDDAAALRGALARTLTLVRQAIVLRDEARRTAMLSVARAHAAAGRELDAVELHARWISSATGAATTVATSEAAVALSRVTGLAPIDVVRALRP